MAHHSVAVTTWYVMEDGVIPVNDVDGRQTQAALLAERSWQAMVVHMRKNVLCCACRVKAFGLYVCSQSLLMHSHQVTDYQHDAVQVCVNRKAGQSNSLSWCS